MSKNCGCSEDTKHYGIFLCHSKEDKKLADVFDEVAPRIGTGVRIFRKEFEKMGSPPEKDIINDICTSKVVFVLVGPGLINIIKNNDRKYWLHTTNWMSFEIGIAAAFKRDIWLVTTDPMFNFPVLDFDVFLPVNSNVSPSTLKSSVEGIIEFYENSPKINFKDPHAKSQKYVYHCPYKNCGTEFVMLPAAPFKLNNLDTVLCPSCGGVMEYYNGKFREKIIIERKSNIQPAMSKDRTSTPDFEVDE